jgi:hypothetical protein
MTEMQQLTPKYWRISTKLRGFTIADGNTSLVVSRLKQPLHVFHLLLNTLIFFLIFSPASSSSYPPFSLPGFLSPILHCHFPSSLAIKLKEVGL